SFQKITMLTIYFNFKAPCMSSAGARPTGGHPGGEVPQAEVDINLYSASSEGDVELKMKRDFQSRKKCSSKSLTSRVAVIPILSSAAKSKKTL
ncbi:MAG TPA: hypothetical protein VGD31_03165, partial [Sphingobacteriaceae bacterium]